ncbi:amidase [Actinomadura barringtoniae]|uniref:Amidase n=1 Tax=Actinomadura barringtoniae TaxID=1427535 RepID=A0A939PAT2_9ACTN|nr:amidase [Actinomadura barringtoniae]MBO2445864.1 amidase [Actinomadura barringtoniae]
MNESVWRVTGGPLVAGAGGGPLDGLSVAVKDLYAVAGERIGAGNPDWLAGAPVETVTSPVVQALLDAGADVAGIAQTDELAFSLTGTNRHYGTPPNPAAPGRIPGGSSSGSASATALGLVDIGLGTDTAGSCRAPASHCGLYGIRTTHGLIPKVGVLPLAPSYDTVGWFARDAGTHDLAGDVLLPGGEPAPVTRFLVADDVVALAEPDTVAEFEKACGRWDVERVESLCEGRLDEWFAAFRSHQASEAWESHGAWIDAHPGSLGPGVTARFEAGRGIDAERRAELGEVVAGARATLRAAIPEGTALLLPCASAPAPMAGSSMAEMDVYRAATLRLTCLASIAGLPSVVMPLLTVGGLPTGLSAVGAPGSDRALLDLAKGA